MDGGGCGSPGEIGDAQQAAFDADAADYAVGDLVQRRDMGQKWGTGFVTSVDPLRVTILHDREAADRGVSGQEWDEVRRVPQVFTCVGNLSGEPSRPPRKAGQVLEIQPYQNLITFKMLPTLPLPNPTPEDASKFPEGFHGPKTMRI